MQSRRSSNLRPKMLSRDHYVPQLSGNRRQFLVWLVVLLIAFTFVLAIVAAPLALDAGRTSLGLAIYQVFSNLCHQLPDRSFHLGEHKLAVCARCTGLYAGFATAVLFYPLLKSLKRTDNPPRKWLFVAAVPLAIDFALGFTGIWENTHWSRFATGALLGAAAVFYIMPGLVDLSLRLFGGAEKKARAVNQAVSPERLATAPSDYSAPERRI